MPATQQDMASSGDARRLTYSNFKPGSPTSQPTDNGHSTAANAASEGQKHYENLSFHILYHAAAELEYMQNNGYGFEGAAFYYNVLGRYSTQDTISRMDYRPSNREAGTSQQAGPHGIIKLSETFEETKISVQRTNVDMLVRYMKLPGTTPLLQSGAQPQVMATRVTEASHVRAGNTLETLGSVRRNKRQKEQTSNLSNQDNDTESSGGGVRRSKKLKVDCDCDTDHSWWMTIKIGELNEALLRINAAMGLVRKFVYQSDDLDRVAATNLVDLLKDSQGILESAKDDMKAEGGTDREALE